jgi:hypothetical protein
MCPAAARQELPKAKTIDHPATPPPTVPHKWESPAVQNRKMKRKKGRRAAQYCKEI